MDVREVKLAGKKKKEPVVNELAPRMPFRMIVCGASGSGKTNAVIDLIERWLPWNILLVYAKHLQSPAYEALRQKVEKKERKLERPISVWSDTLDEIVPLDELNPENSHVAVFDDFVMDAKAQSTIADWFVRGRHKSVSPIYISQSYYAVPKIVRNNASVVLIFRGYNGHDLVNLYKDFGGGMRRDEFERFLHDATRRPHGFAVIDDNPALPELRYRIGWDTLVVPDEDSDEPQATRPSRRLGDETQNAAAKHPRKAH